MPEVLLKRTYRLRGRDFDKAGETSTEIKSLLRDIGIDPLIIRRAVVVAFEAEMNLVMYADRGALTLTLSDEQIVITASDEGPGIPDIELAMQEGYSTASDEMREMGFGFGMGLPNIRKNSDDLTLESEVGKGTWLNSRIFLGTHD